MKKVVRVVIFGVIGLVALVALGLGGVMAMSMSRQGKVYEIATQSHAVPDDEAAVAEGQRLFTARGCADCHGVDGAGKVVIDAPIGRVVGTNLSTLPADYPFEDFELALRHGVSPEGRALFFMPAHEFAHMRDDEVAMLLAYVRTLPDVQNTLPDQALTPLSRILHVTGAMPMFPVELVDHEATYPHPPSGRTEAFGEYLTRGCVGCHGPGLSGGPMPGAPPEVMGIPANLTPHATGLASWSEEDFLRAVRTGLRPDGTEINEQFMPLVMLRGMTEDELGAIYLYLRTLPPTEFGNR